MEQCIPGHALPAGTGGAAPGHLASLAASLAAKTRPSQRGQHSLQSLLDDHRDTETQQRKERRDEEQQSKEEDEEEEEEERRR